MTYRTTKGLPPRIDPVKWACWLLAWSGADRPLDPVFEATKRGKQMKTESITINRAPDGTLTTRTIRDRELLATTTGLDLEAVLDQTCEHFEGRRSRPLPPVAEVGPFDFGVGDLVRCWDFKPCAGRTDQYVEGVVKSIGGGMLAVHVIKDTCFPIGARFEIYTAQRPLVGDWPGRLELIESAAARGLDLEASA